MLVKCSTAFFCVAVATSSAGASVGQVRYPAHGKDSALGALSTRRRDDSTARWHQQELTSARGAATTLRGGILGLKTVSGVVETIRDKRCKKPEGVVVGQGAHEEDPHGDMSVSTAILNIVADLCPHGMLPVAYGMAAVGGTGLVVAPALLASFGLISAYTMISVGRACQRTKRWSFSGLWTELIGKKSAWVVELAMALMTFGCCIFYMAFAGDLFSALAGTVSSFPAVLKKRAVDLVILGLCPLLPLCLMKNLSALQYTSFVGVVSILYTTLFVVKRSLDGTYSEGGDFFKTIDERFRSPVPAPWAAVKLWRVGPGLVTLMNMSCVAFMCHYNGVKYYEELEERTEKKYAITIGSAMAISFGVFTTMMLFGFRTFGGAAQALLLNNYHRTDDPLASLARLATGFSILCGFPLMFAALKTSFFNAASEISEKFGEGGANMARRFQSDEGLRVGCIVSLMTAITSVACTKSEEDVATIIGLIGAILGSGANYIIPAVFNISLLKRLGAHRGVLSEVSLNKAIIVFGAVFMVMGTVVTLKEAGAHH